MATPPDETLNVKAGICICNVEGIICAKLSARILQLSIHHDQNRDTDSRCEGQTRPTRGISRRRVIISFNSLN